MKSFDLSRVSLEVYRAYKRFSHLQIDATLVWYDAVHSSKVALSVSKRFFFASSAELASVDTVDVLTPALLTRMHRQDSRLFRVR